MPIPRSGTAGLGIVLYLAGVAMFAVNDALGKWLVADYGVGQLMLLRTIGAGVVLAPMVLSLRVKIIDPRRPGCKVSAFSARRRTRSRSTIRRATCRWLT